MINQILQRQMFKLPILYFLAGCYMRCSEFGSHQHQWSYFGHSQNKGEQCPSSDLDYGFHQLQISKAHHRVIVNYQRTFSLRGSQQRYKFMRYSVCLTPLPASELISSSYVLGSKLVTASLRLHFIAALSYALINISRCSSSYID